MQRKCIFRNDDEYPQISKLRISITTKKEIQYDKGKVVYKKYLRSERREFDNDILNLSITFCQRKFYPQETQTNHEKRLTSLLQQKRRSELQEKLQDTKQVKVRKARK